VITSIIKSFFPFKLEKGVNFGIGAAPENVLALSSSSPSSEPIASAPPAVIITTSKEGGEGVVPTAPLASSSSEGEAVLTPTAPPLASSSADELSESQTDDHQEAGLVSPLHDKLVSLNEPITSLILSADALDSSNIMTTSWLKLPLKTTKPTSVAKKLAQLETTTISSIQITCTIPQEERHKTRTISLMCLRVRLQQWISCLHDPTINYSYVTIPVVSSLQEYSIPPTTSSKVDRVSPIILSIMIMILIDLAHLFIDRKSVV
jgi:hypothetical protein